MRHAKSNSVAIALVILTTAIVFLGIPVCSNAEDRAQQDSGHTQTGHADNWRILWVGGYRQQGVYQGVQDDRESQRIHREMQQDKKDRAEDARHTREAEYKHKRELEDSKREQEREKQKEKQDNQKQPAKEKRCKGLGLPANCTEANPGRGHK